MGRRHFRKHSGDATPADAAVASPLPLCAGKAVDQGALMALKLDAKQRFDALLGGPGMNMFQVRAAAAPEPRAPLDQSPQARHCMLRQERGRFAPSALDGLTRAEGSPYKAPLLGR
jgi:hypothetical protein